MPARLQVNTIRQARRNPGSGFGALDNPWSNSIILARIWTTSWSTVRGLIYGKGLSDKPSIATHRELGFEVESFDLAVQELATDYFAFDQCVQTIDQNAHHFPTLLAATILLALRTCQWWR